MMNSKIEIARGLLLKWMAYGEKKRSYESIRKNCEYLDQAYELGLGSNAIWTLFHPLFRTGVIEFAGKDCYALSPTIAIEYDGHFIYNSPLPQKKSHRTKFSGIYRTENPEDVEGIKIVHFNAEKILRHIPSVKEVIDSYPISIEDLSQAKYYQYKGAKGLTKRVKEGTVRYFCIPELLYQREVPGRSINPDAFNIAYNYSRSINGIFSGKFYSRQHILEMQSFGLPIIIERILFLESMLYGNPIENDDRCKRFFSISNGAVKQLNRILCDTIEYE